MNKQRMHKKRLRALFCMLIGTAALWLFACAPQGSPTPVAQPEAEPPATASVAVVTPMPTATPEPAWLDADVDFLGQDALRTAVQYALKSNATQFTGRTLADVEELILVDGAHIADLTPLAHAESLRSLVILDGSMDLAPLAALPNLTRLTLAGGHFGDLNHVAVLNNLEELNLFHYDTSDFTPLKALPKLHTLRLGNHKSFSYTGLDELTNLTTLLIADRARNDLSWLSSLTNLTDLTIWPCKQRDLAWITSLQNLTSLHLDMRTDGDLTPLKELTKLQRLAVNFESGRLLDPMWLKKLVNLEELYLRGAYFGDLEMLERLTKLQKLTLDDVRTDLDIQLLPALNELAVLNIRNCDVAHAEALKKLPSLTEFRLYNGTIDNHLAVYQLENLTALALRPQPEGGARSLGGVERLTNLVNLTELDWGGRAGKLEELAALTELQTLNLSGAQVKKLEPLTALTQLQSLDVSNNRFSRIPDLSALEKLQSFTLVGSRIKDFSALSTAKSLMHATLQSGKVVDPAQLAAVERLYDVTLVDDVENERQAEKLHLAQQAVDEALRTHLSYANTADSRAVKERFMLNSYLHEPYFGSPAWYTPLAQTY